MLPPAPALLSTTTETPRFSESLFAMIRAAVSVAPPAANPTISVTGLFGHPAGTCATAWAAAKSAPAARKSNRFIGAPLCCPSSPTGLDHDPRRRMVARLLQPAHPLVDPRVHQPRRKP